MSTTKKPPKLFSSLIEVIPGEYAIEGTKDAWVVYRAVGDGESASASAVAYFTSLPSLSRWLVQRAAREAAEGARTLEELGVAIRARVEVVCEALEGMLAP